MKKFILLFTITLSFIQGKAQLFHEDFEVTDSVFNVPSTGQAWGSNNTFAAGGGFSYTSRILNIGDTSILSTTIFDCSTAANVFLSFDHICKIDLSDKAIIEVSADSGISFIQLSSGYLGSAVSWNGSFSPSSYTNWSGVIPDNSMWHHEIFNLSGILTNIPGAVIRLKLYDDNGNGGISPGWYIDNFSIDTLAVPDAGIEAVVNPGIISAQGATDSLICKITNSGSDTIFSMTTGYSLNGGPISSQTWNGIIPPNTSMNINMSTFSVPAGPYSILGSVSLNGDKLTANDTLSITSISLPVLTIPYSDDFEGANAGWFDPNVLNYPTLWQSGIPNYGVTNTAHSGTRCWDTNLDTSYIGSCNSILYSPYFDFSTVGNASVSFWLNYKTEPFSDGTRLEYNANGTGWYTLGLANNPLNSNWYTDSLLSSTQQPGWEGNSGGWIQSTYPLPSQLSNQASVQFRFVFSADIAVNSDGISMDDFSVSFSACGNSVYSSTTPTTCGDSITFGFTASSPVANIHWDLGNGITSAQPTVNGFFTSGNYLVTLYTVDSNGCAASSVSPVTVTTGFSVFAGPDVLSCGGAAQLNALPSVPGSYQYSWTPGIGLNNSGIKSPLANHTDSLTYTVTVIDSVTGCTASDQVIATVFSGYNDVLSICNGSGAILDLGPGANSYLWQIFTDTLGTIYPLNTTNQNLYITQPGFYNATAVFPVCGVMNSIFQITIDSTCTTNVWPGDCNFDLKADNTDLLNIGIAYNSSGIIRAGANISWTAQPASDWPYYFASGINLKHSDTNGDGLIDSLDITAILQNYGLSHPLKSLPSGNQSTSIAPIYLTADKDTAGNSDLITVTINLGSLAIPVDSIYGIAYSINYEQSLIDITTGASDFTNSWLGTISTNMISLEKHYASSGFSDFAIVRTDHNNVLSGNGPIGVFTIVTTDNLSGIAKIHFNLDHVYAITYQQGIIPLTQSGDSVVLDPAFTGISENGNENEIVIYPNPASTDLTIRTKNINIISVELKNTIGQLISKTECGSTIAHIPLTGLSKGIFFLSVLTDKGVISKKVQVIK